MGSPTLTMRRLTILVLAALLLAPGVAGAEDVRVSIFYYPWYGTPGRDGSYQHWQQNGHAPPARIASAFYPARGLYSSSDLLVLGAQMREIARAGIDQVATSWWGWGSIEDTRLPTVVAAARGAGLDVAVHLEPYGGRTPATTEIDVRHLAELGITDYYLYSPHDAAPEEWAPINARLEGVRIFAQTPLAGFAAAAGFEGIYTYDIVNSTGDKLLRICDGARRLNLLCAPSVGPGYDARRASKDQRVKPRRQGRTYDAMWGLAIKAGASLVTITSYNEWHEGTQIEAARARRGRDGVVYQGYDGAWGLHGRRAERAYLIRTAYWTRRFAEALRILQPQ